MRTLVIMRGAQGSGKSTLIEKAHLERYTLSADKIRLMLSAPEVLPDGTEAINQENNTETWAMLYNILEKRMSNGNFTIVDAIHATKGSFATYKKLAEKYRYRVYCVDLSGVDIETCKKQNKLRDVYAQIPDTSIEKAFRRFSEGIPSWVTVITPEEFLDMENGPLAFKTIDLSEYKKIHHIGDIHGCFDALTEYLGGTELKDDEAYIFCGDYLDRGIQNVDVMNFMMNIVCKKNVFLLEGNHENHLNHWANNRTSNGKAFEEKTKFDLEAAGIDKKNVRSFIRKLLQCAYYTYNGKTVVVTHAGIPCLPNVFMSTKSYIKGTGSYKDAAATDNAFFDNTAGNCYTIHGHRNIEHNDVAVNDRAFNLEDSVEFGGNLRVVTLSSDGFETFEIKNNVYQPLDYGKHNCDFDSKDMNKVIEVLSSSEYIKEKKMPNSNISSFNFSRNAFSQGQWTHATVKARGLFINTKLKKVVARGYEKFFKVDERPKTTLEELKENLIFPVTAYVKENGFLGILGYDDEKDDLFIASKSTIEGEFAGYFKKILFDSLNEEKKENLKKYLKENNRGMVFEVIDVENDPHLIKYDKSKLVLLDVLEREIDFKHLPYEEMIDVATQFGFEYKEKACVLENWEQFLDFHNTVTKEYYTYEDRFVEGFVLEDASGFMIKEKTHFYNFWKFMRALSYDILSSGRCRKNDRLEDPKARDFTCWLIHQVEMDKVSRDEDIISLREKYLRDTGIDC